MKIVKLALASAVLFVAMGIQSTQAAPWTFTTSGTITAGDDRTGTFGNGGYIDLSGQTYSQSWTVDPSLYQYQYVDAIRHDSSGQMTGTATETLTINGVSKVYVLDLSQYNWGESYLQNSATQYGGGGAGNGFFDEAVQYQHGYTTDGFYLLADSWILSNNPLNLGLNFDQTWSNNPQPWDQAGFIFSYYGGTYMRGSVTSASINSPVVAVPEPETYAMLLAGLGLLGVAGRRRNGVSRQAA